MADIAKAQARLAAELAGCRACRDGKAGTVTRIAKSGSSRSVSLVSELTSAETIRFLTELLDARRPA